MKRDKPPSFFFFLFLHLISPPRLCLLFAIIPSSKNRGLKYHWLSKYHDTRYPSASLPSDKTNILENQLWGQNHRIFKITYHLFPNTLNKGTATPVKTTLLTTIVSIP
uniref:Lipocalin n=1 Tax=Rhipicephalus appendiculatus TaxID=34631 RepID=A0A131YAM4_RHIAP